MGHGAIGVEVKASGLKVGPGLTQAVDYGRALFRLQTNSVLVALDWVFVWPLKSPGGTVASVMAHNRIGAAWADPWRRFHLACGHSNVLRVYPDGRVKIGDTKVGQRTGSRSLSRGA